MPFLIDMKCALRSEFQWLEFVLMNATASACEVPLHTIAVIAFALALMQVMNLTSPTLIQWAEYT